MKSLIHLSGLLFWMCSAVLTQASVGAAFTTSAVKTDSFHVSGNCGMCKSHIEDALKNVKGIESSNWDKEAKKITVTYDPSVIRLLEIKQLIAAAGYDTDEIKATAERYNGLPVCCKYER